MSASPRDALVYYVSGHGFGHARRSAQVIRALHARRPGTDVHVRTSAAAHIFDSLPAERVSPSRLDAGMAEDDALTINAEATLRRLEDLIGKREEITKEELQAIRSLCPGLIVTDIPFLAGDVADAAGVPCIAISNFSWDWICEPLFAGSASLARRYERLSPIIRAGYAKVRLALRLPFGDLSEAFPRVLPVPLIAARTTRERSAILSAAGLLETDGRPRVLVGMRGGLPDSVVSAAAADAPDFLLLSPGAPHRPSDAPGNLLNVATAPTLDFSDLVSISDAVVSKLGYGTVAECIAGKSRMLWPRRRGFREDDVMMEQAPRFLPAIEISTDDFHAGRWGTGLRKLMKLPPSREAMRVDGAEVCAELIDQALAGTWPAIS